MKSSSTITSSPTASDDACVKAKGDKSWTQFRLEQMDEVARDLVVKPARKINPKVKVVLKFPNWYEHYQGLGYNLEAGVKYFDGIYTGTETREPFNNAQHLQQYQGYLIVRYLKTPTRAATAAGGWTPAACVTRPLRRTTLVDAVRQSAGNHALRPAPGPAPDAAFRPRRMAGPASEFRFRSNDGLRPAGRRHLGGARHNFPRGGIHFDQVDAFLGKLGQPVGLKSYKPVNSVGEDYVQITWAWSAFHLS